MRVKRASCLLCACWGCPGSGWTLAHLFDFDERWQLVLEALQVEGRLEQRADVGLDEHLREETVQLAVRYSF